MRKKPRSAKQKANDRKLGRMAKLRARGSSVKKRVTSRKRKTNKSPVRSSPMRRRARARAAGSKAKRGVSKIKSTLRGGIKGDYFMARGAGQTARDFMDKTGVQGQTSAIIELGVEGLAGGVKGAILAEVEKKATGKPSIIDMLGNLGFGGASTQSSNNGTVLG